MLFNSGAFLAAFAAFAVIYYAAAHRFRWVLLLGASLAFYAMLASAYVPLLIAVTASRTRGDGHRAGEQRTATEVLAFREPSRSSSLCSAR